ncbi:MAG: hypothetical protein H6618_09920 [Deltaproteobacteria bacterium]|nr:hypothetical protein [Deltaproteobacteria bacterium]
MSENNIRKLLSLLLVFISIYTLVFFQVSCKSTEVHEKIFSTDRKDHYEKKYETTQSDSYKKLIQDMKASFKLYHDTKLNSDSDLNRLTTAVLGTSDEDMENIMKDKDLEKINNKNNLYIKMAGGGALGLLGVVFIVAGYKAYAKYNLIKQDILLLDGADERFDFFKKYYGVNFEKFMEIHYKASQNIAGSAEYLRRLDYYNDNQDELDKMVNDERKRLIDEKLRDPTVDKKQILDIKKTNDALVSSFRRVNLARTALVLGPALIIGGIMTVASEMTEYRLTFSPEDQLLYMINEFNQRLEKIRLSSL